MSEKDVKAEALKGNAATDALRNKKVEELNLTAQETEIYEFLFYTPPPAFQNIFINAGVFVDDENNFVLEDYQQAVQEGALPEELNTAALELLVP